MSLALPSPYTSVLPSLDPYSSYFIPSPFILGDCTSNSQRKFRGYQARTPSASVTSTPETNILAPLITPFYITVRSSLQGHFLFLCLIPAPAHLFYDLLLSTGHFLSYISSIPFFCIFPSLKTKTPINQNLKSTFVLYQAIFLTLPFLSSLSF